MRVNISLDKSTSESIESLRMVTGWTTAQIIERGVALMELEMECERKQSKESPWVIAQRVELIGCAEAPSELSENYK